MKFDDDILRELLATFADEAQEYLRTLNQHILALEQGVDESARKHLFDEVLRAAHSLKGASRAVNLDDVEHLVHRLEDLLNCIRDDRDSTTDVFDLIYTVLDAIGALVAKGVSGAETDVDVPGLSSRLQAARTKPARAADHTFLGDEELRSSPPQDPQYGAPATRGSTDEGDSGVRAEGAAGRQPSGPPAPVTATLTTTGVITKTHDETVRVDTRKLDLLMATVGELVSARIGLDHRVAEGQALSKSLKRWDAGWRSMRAAHRELQRIKGQEGLSYLDGARGDEIQAFTSFVADNEARLDGFESALAQLVAELRSDARRLSQLISALQDQLMTARMLPASTIFVALPRLVRDLARQSGKEARLEILGDDTEVDRSVLEQIKDPLVHLIRNCMDHGVELPERRKQAGKPSQGTITISVRYQGDTLAVDVSDDGSGIDARAVTAKAVQTGLLPAESADVLSERESLWLVFRSGLSTSETITDVSGRGIGLDVVRDAVEALNGKIDISSRPGAGTTISLLLPLSISTTRCLLVRVATQVFALPISSVSRIVAVRPDDVRTTAGTPVVSAKGRVVPVVSLAGLLDVGMDDARPDARRLALIVDWAHKQHGFLVDEILGVQELAVKSLPAPLARVSHVAGASILATGRAVVVLNIAELARTAERRYQPRTVMSALASTQAPDRRRIIVVDDSITTRTLERNILEAAGYDVAVAADGSEAWSLLMSEGCDLVVSDIMMPNMNGFELTAKIRAHDRLRDVPVILVTTLESQEDRRRGVDVGADAYMVKSSFEQEQLLATIRELT